MMDNLNLAIVFRSVDAAETVLFFAVAAGTGKDSMQCA
jgi:hypothetical protein